jgi:tricorn protease
MRARTVFSLLLVALFAAVAAGQSGPDVKDTRLLAQPALSRDHIAFVYANAVWVADPDGRNVRRLTSDAGEVSNPVFSPDGKLLAFSAQYEGNTDAYVVPVEGGVPRRLTWHPGNDLVQGFTPDGSAVLFTSPRAVHTSRYLQLFTVPVGGGVEQRLEIPNAARASCSPDGKRIAYNPVGPVFLEWKHYRGGTTSKIWLFSIADHSIEKVPQPPGRSNDVDPQWMGDAVYFRSDRDGEFNLYAYDTRTKQVGKLTSHSDFPVLSASASDGKILYEQAGWLHLYDVATGADRRLVVGVAADLAPSMPRFVQGAKYIRAASPSPSGARVAFEFRGEIVTLPAEKGDPRNLTESVAAHDRGPAWSPDGKWIAHVSDESGEYMLHIRPQDGKGAVRKWKLTGAGFYDRLEWSPDSKKIAYTDNAWALYWLDVATGAVKKVAQEPLYGPVKTIRGRWSPDSNWITYTLNSMTYTQTAYVYSLDQDKSHAVTDGLSDVTEPVFDRSGKYLFFFASTNAGPVSNWFSLMNEEDRVTRTIWLAVLRGDLPNPLARESDEEKGAASEAGKEKKDDDKKEAGKKADKKDSEPAAKVEPVRIDFDGLPLRILDLPIKAADFSELQAGAAGQVFFLREADGKKALQRFDLKDRKTETLLPEVDDYELTADGKKLLWRHTEAWTLSPAAGKKIEAGEGKLKVESLEVRVDPRAEWPEIFHEVWRINRDYFYDPHMHGVDWPAMEKKYAQFLPHVATRQDLNRVIQWMCSELAVGHHRGGGGDTFLETKTVPGGLLGADYEVANGRYRFQKVYGGLNWNPELRSPLTEPGVNVKAGEYLIAVGGRDVKPPASVYSFFENTAGKAIEITVAPNADGSGSRTVTVVPVESELGLRNRDWVEGNLRKVEAATGGRVAYVYVPNTATLGYTYFKRYFFPQSDKDAVIVDERYNGGGSVADYYIDLLQKQTIGWWAMRYGADMKTPSASIQGPKVMIIDENAGSGGDLLPWMFRKFKVGTIVGERTWGGLVGVLGFPVLMDGGRFTAPNLAFWTAEKGWEVENEGVPPDIEVEQTPADVIAGRDPQLEKSIAVVMAELAKNPPVRPKRPPYPDKTSKPARSAGR